MSNSSLVSYTNLSPNCTKPRNHAIDTISIHCMAGKLTAKQCLNLSSFTTYSTTKGSSCNYAIGYDGEIALGVDEANRSWCTSSSSNDHRAITIEVANTVAADPWPVSDKAYAALLDLVTDICRRNSIKKLLWQGDKSLIGQVDEQNMTVHRWFAAKACPGDYLYSRHAEIAEEVNKRLNGSADNTTEEDEEEMTLDQFKELYKEMIAEKKGDEPSDWAKDSCEKAKSAGTFGGDGEGNFNWQDPVSREALAAVMDRAGVI